MQIHVHTHNCTQTYKFILSAGFSGKGPEIAKRQRKEKKKKIVFPFNLAMHLTSEVSFVFVLSVCACSGSVKCCIM